MNNAKSVIENIFSSFTNNLDLLQSKETMESFYILG